MSSNDNRKMKPWVAWLLFFVTVGIVFLLGMLAASITQRRAEVVSILNNKKVNITGIESRNEIFAENYPREYESWIKTADTTFQSEFNGSSVVDVLAQRPEMVILWAGYAFSKDYGTPRGHMHAVEDIHHTLRTGAPMSSDEGPQPATCWTCKSPDVPRLMDSLGIAEYYKGTWASLGQEVVNPIGCADCHEAETMNLKISRPGLIEGFRNSGQDIHKVSQQEMRSLACAQCHVEYYFSPEGKYLIFPWHNGLTVEGGEQYYDSIRFADYTHKLSRAPIIKAQHPDYEIYKTGIHAQRGVSCADCHMPYVSEGGVKYTSHHVRSPLASINNTCQVCHRESEETLRTAVFERQRSANEIRNRVEKELATAHIEAKFAWEKGATEAQMEEVLQLLRQSQWRWDYAVASHGGSFHSPVEFQRILSMSLDRAHKARFVLSKVLAQLGYIGDVPMPDISTKEKAQAYIGLDMRQEREAKKQFMETVVPKWLETAKANNRLVSRR
ncbi:ammonia-forming cytochrome c nitrite reductase [Petrimonas sulfuriphila]|jgi:nitrite reductase (cytochrome c-552)|uniref:ammonia-forming cytochrome c nitrite reductase n=1 Tax=Petrimonas TaxID=307628 RepID=UPI000F0C8888|nr:ammonia-forming cytochrome c nitrite reductase [Proteiniphilum sp. UBA5218]MDD3542037.1 ammonia-forming cytochrome c nitrite reductase [Petrimonas sp.]NLU30162.1 ammonia-forming cytochrome c nitrite reductase [Bacteroidales bacterium]BBD45125.1 cytochrome c552 [Petrimonas sp. IBARAKI]MDX9775327.1 ammonia-forming cytochrome c nitrite reductase [Petrimonas sp.]MEA4995981.1 ammonia-forming cytochrome c nitrite reductase [Petrimonas sp.]